MNIPFFIDRILHRAMELEILYEDNHIIAVNKPGGMLVQSDETGDSIIPDLVKGYIGEKYNKPGNVFLGIVHRLDRPVSGVVLFGRTSKATRRLNEAFRQAKVEKTYLAIVEHAPPKQSDDLVAHLVKNARVNKSFVAEKDSKHFSRAKRSELSYRWVAASDNYHLLEVKPKTGRHHQIRVMLNAIGCTIKGDLKYGARRSNPSGSISLHARSIRFTHPVKKEATTITAPFPVDDIWDVFEYTG
jgi:23S rRNA pseudouridine1911/1915/1917 synthase